MPCERIPGGIVCYNRRYKYEGYYFEWHSYGGPEPLRKDGEPRKRDPRGFWDAMVVFGRLSDDEKKQYEVG